MAGSCGSVDEQLLCEPDEGLVQDVNLAGVRPRITAEGEEVDACMLGRGGWYVYA